MELPGVFSKIMPPPCQLRPFPATNNRSELLRAISYLQKMFIQKMFGISTPFHLLYMGQRLHGIAGSPQATAGQHSDPATLGLLPPRPEHEKSTGETTAEFRRLSTTLSN
ncbi:hypothetical protein, partial [Thiolapillus sp.]|uniref:hypothetical protein n=1 Tax=Thiolapillus sp. TaxID=2017437 RepID=UPI003AF5153E